MARVVYARKLKDQAARWLWELRPECGHFHYELVEKYPQQPVHVMCRVCAGIIRVKKYLATLNEHQLNVIRGHPVLSAWLPESTRKTLVAGGVGAIPQEQHAPEPQTTSDQSQWESGGGQDGVDGAEISPELPSCMRPRPGAPAPRPVPGLTPEPAPQMGERLVGAGGAKIHRRHRKRGPDPNQTRLFE
jgi:hypothetical protein